MTGNYVIKKVYVSASLCFIMCVCVNVVFECIFGQTCIHNDTKRLRSFIAKDKQKFLVYGMISARKVISHSNENYKGILFAFTTLLGNLGFITAFRKAVYVICFKKLKK